MFMSTSHLGSRADPVIRTQFTVFVGGSLSPSPSFHTIQAFSEFQNVQQELAVVYEVQAVTDTVFNGVSFCTPVSV